MNKEIEDKIENAVKTSTDVVKQSADDWVAYIQDHPMQSALFGVLAYFAIKGLISSSMK